MQQLEQQYSRRIMDILEPVVGRDNVKAQARRGVRQTESTSSSSAQTRTPDSSRAQPAGTGAGSAKEDRHGAPGAKESGRPAPSAALHQRRQSGAQCGYNQDREQTNKRESTTTTKDKTVKVVRPNIKD